LDVLSSVILYVCATAAVAGALTAAISSGSPRFLGLLVLGVATAAILALLSAGFAALVWLLAGTGSALLVGVSTPRAASGFASTGASALNQLAAAAAAALFAVLAYAAFRGPFHPGGPSGALGAVNAASLGRLLFDREALAAVALGAALLAGVSGGTAFWRTRRR
jgi:hypothetical protein